MRGFWNLTGSLKLLGFLFFFQGGNGGYVDFVCSRDPKESGNNSTLIFACHTDCIKLHGAVGGFCGDASVGDFNCYCGPLTGKRNEESLHCIHPHQERYSELCVADCLCNHGAAWGHCNWDLKACVCEGHNPKNVFCPAETSVDFGKIIYRKAGEVDLGPVGMAFVRKILNTKLE